MFVFLFASIEYSSVSARLFESVDVHKHGIVLGFTLISLVSVTYQRYQDMEKLYRRSNCAGLEVQITACSTWRSCLAKFLWCPESTRPRIIISFPGMKSLTFASGNNNRFTAYSPLGSAGSPYLSFSRSEASRISRINIECFRSPLCLATTIGTLSRSVKV